MTMVGRTAIAEHAVADVADLDAVIADGSIDARVRGTLRRVRQRRLAEVPGVPVSAAAQLLGLSAQTVRAWLAAGILDQVAHAKPVKVATDRLAEVMMLVAELRGMGTDRGLITAVAHRLEDIATVSAEPVRNSLDQMRHGEVELFDARQI